MRERARKTILCARKSLHANINICWALKVTVLIFYGPFIFSAKQKNRSSDRIRESLLLCICFLLNFFSLFPWKNKIFLCWSETINHFFCFAFCLFGKKNDNDYKKQPIMRIWSTNKTKVAISDFRVGPARWIWELIIFQKLEWWFCSKLKLFSYIRWRDYVFFFPINSISKFDRVVM